MAGGEIEGGGGKLAQIIYDGAKFEIAHSLRIVLFFLEIQ